MTDWSEYAAYYIERLDGPDRDNAYHSLVEADGAIIPILIDAFQSEQDPGIRSQLVKVVWRYRLPETAEFLSEALNDLDPQVWKSALDGLVAIGGSSAIRVLESAKQRVESGHQVKTARIEWIDEAVQQIREKGA